ncbi:hypothetical protein CVT91_00220 [Candidatus Atribacteria bacterium HGW-Atribacteria-1]|nr:MAG: hypothetical protein CVT91_00220 [Candidatus Atribacteria bacterium HGW-Atribacteria-1]
MKKIKKQKVYEEIKHKGKLIAIILRSDFSADKSVFFGQPEFSQQLGYIKYGKNGVIKAHCHKEAHRKIVLTQEVLFIKKGMVEVNFYSEKQNFLTYRIVKKGDIVFLCSGGHGFRMLKDSEMIEVKQGPYSGRDSDKILFEGVENDSGK